MVVPCQTRARHRVGCRRRRTFVPRVDYQSSGGRLQKSFPMMHGESTECCGTRVQTTGRRTQHPCRLRWILGEYAGPVYRLMKPSCAGARTCGLNLRRLVSPLALRAVPEHSDQFPKRSLSGPTLTAARAQLTKPSTRE